jgi:hypothetical protein
MSAPVGADETALPPTALEQIEQICDGFEAAWRAGRRPRIEDELDAFAGAGRRDLLEALLTLELAYRRRCGERPTRREYQARFPDDAERVRSVFGELDQAGRPTDNSPRPHRPREADRNLLFGILALQMDFINREALIAAMNAWVLEKQKPLGELLVAAGALSAQDHALLEPMVARHIQMHGGDPEASLAAVSSLGSIRDDLHRLGDADLQASLAATTSRALGSGGDADATAVYTSSSARRAGEQFRIIRLHAEGGLGRVYEALDEVLGRRVALKEIQPDKADEPTHRSRFVLEAEINGGLQHPAIVPIYSLGSYDDGKPFYAMRFVEGSSLGYRPDCCENML